MNSSAANPEPIICEVCGAYFENKRGLSSHARLHLRQLGMRVTENSGSPIELLYQLIEEKNDSPEDSTRGHSASVLTPPKKADGQLECSTSPEQEDVNSSTKSGGTVLSKLQKSDHQGSPSKLKEQGAALLPSSPSALRPNEGSSSLSDHQTKPMWAPSDTDAPITLGRFNQSGNYEKEKLNHTTLILTKFELCVKYKRTPDCTDLQISKIIYVFTMEHINFFN